MIICQHHQTELTPNTYYRQGHFYTKFKGNSWKSLEAFRDEIFTTIRYTEKQTFATFMANIIGIEHGNLSNQTIRGPFYKAVYIGV